MSLLLNASGASAADPILVNLGLQLVLSPTTMDVATLNDAGVDQAAGFPITTSIKSALSPAASVVTQGTNGAYTASNARLNIGSTSGLSVGDLLYLSHAAITAGFYEIASIPLAGFVTLVSDPFAAGGVDRTGVSYENAWRYDGVAGTSPILSSAGGQINYLKMDGSDSVGNATQFSDSFYVRDAPSSALAFITIDGKTYAGATTRQITPAFDLLPGWANRGGVSHVQLANHSVQSANQFRWGDGTTTEKTLAAALASGLSFTAGDGQKYGRVLLKSKSGAAVSYGVDLNILLDTTGPGLALALRGR